MGVSSIDDVLAYVGNDELNKKLIKCKDEHNSLQDEIDDLLKKYKDEGKDPAPVAKGMSWMKTNVMLAMNDSD